MHVIMGGTGHVGSATAKALLKSGEAVTIVTRDAARAAAWREKGAEVAEAEVGDVESLRAALRRGRRAFLLNPPGDPAGDSDAAERRSVANILAALDGAGLEKVVAQSTGGARPGKRIGDFAPLWTLEEGLRAQPIPAAINRAAYYMSNWDGLLEAVRATGRLPTFFPADLPIPMVAPRDLGEVAARRLVSPPKDGGILYVEGPERYSAADVARAFTRALGRPVEPEVVPRSEWQASFLAMGFSEASALSYAGMIALSLDEGFDMPEGDSWRGQVTLEEYVEGLVAGP